MTTEDQTSTRTLGQLASKWKWAIVGAIIVFLGLFYFVQHNSVVNKGNQYQQDMIPLYNDTTNVLSSCIVKTKQSVGATKGNTAAVTQVISEAVRGRYQGDTSAQPGNGALFSAIQEAYPSTDMTSETFQKVLIIINGCRDDFEKTQRKLQDEVSRFNKWRTGSWRVRHLGGGSYPTEALEIEVNKKPVTGMAALRQMRRLIVVSEAQSGRDTGVIENEDPFATN